MRDRRALHLLYPDGSGIRHVWASPSLGAVVRRYIATQYGVQPREVMRRRYVWLDCGGAAVIGAPRVRIDLDGWSVQLQRYHADVYADAFAQRARRPPKVYPGGALAHRVVCMDWTVIMTPDEAAQVLAVLRPLALQGATERAALEAEVRAHAGDYLLPAVPRPVLEA